MSRKTWGAERSRRCSTEGRRVTCSTGSRETTVVEEALGTAPTPALAPIGTVA